MQKPHSHSLRKGRVSIPNQIYLVTFVTERRQRIFSDFWCCRIAINTLRNESKIKTLAFVIMPDHVHWLMQLSEKSTLSAAVQSVKSVSAHRVCNHLKHNGKIWQSGFHDHALRRNEDIKHAARYIIYNPIRAGLAKTIKKYSHWDAFWV